MNNKLFLSTWQKRFQNSFSILSSRIFLKIIKKIFLVIGHIDACVKVIVALD